LPDAFSKANSPAISERAKVAGSLEKSAEEALGHNSKVLHRVYADTAAGLARRGSLARKSRPVKTSSSSRQIGGDESRPIALELWQPVNCYGLCMVVFDANISTPI